jgi:hypothetical protein
VCGPSARERRTERPSHPAWRATAGRAYVDFLAATLPEGVPGMLLWDVANEKLKFTGLTQNSQVDPEV